MLPDFDAEGRFTRSEILMFSLILMLSPAVLMPHAGAAALIALIASGGLLLYPAVNLVKTSSRMMAKKVVHASVIYLPTVLLIAGVSKLSG